ncbi:MAG TPA: hypothetical protein DHV96_00735 [Lachnospiraceae bacterium]|nr:hypothetical protein [Lachnospiraceae bacterium]
MTLKGKLTPSEEFVMKAIWDCKTEPVLQDILLQVNDLHGKGWSPQTVSTFISKLCRKNFILMQRNGKTYRYKVLVQERDYQQYKLKYMLMYIYNNNIELFLEDVNGLKNN